MRAVAFPLKSSLQKRATSTDTSRKTDSISLYIVLMSRNEQKNNDCLLNFQGNAQAWGKNTLIFAGKYHERNRLWRGVLISIVVNSDSRRAAFCTSSYGKGAIGSARRSHVFHGVSISNPAFCTLSEMGDLTGLLMWLHKRTRRKVVRLGQSIHLRNPFPLASHHECSSDSPGQFIFLAYTFHVSIC